LPASTLPIIGLPDAAGGLPLADILRILGEQHVELGRLEHELLGFVVTDEGPLAVLRAMFLCFGHVGDPLDAGQVLGEALVARRRGLRHLPANRVFLDDPLGFRRRVGQGVSRGRIVAVEDQVQLIGVFAHPFAAIPIQLPQQLLDRQFQRLVLVLQPFPRCLQLVQRLGLLFDQRVAVVQAGLLLLQL
jgi:hypothetical protein